MGFPTFSDSLTDEPSEGFRKIRNKASLTLGITNNILQYSYKCHLYEMGWACGSYGWGEGAYRFLVGKPEGKRPWGDLGVDGWIISPLHIFVFDKVTLRWLCICHVLLLSKYVVLKTLSCKKQKRTTISRDKKWVTFTYFSPIIRRITNLFKQANLNIAFRATNTIQQLTEKQTNKIFIVAPCTL